MRPNRGGRFLPLLITLLIVAVVIAAIVSVGRAIFSGGTPTQTTEEINTARKALLNTDTLRSVEMKVRGPIVAQENFTSYRIFVSPEVRMLDVYKGYYENRTSGKKLSNSNKAYVQFVYALDKANMTEGINLDKVSGDLRGICASGYVYQFSVQNDGNKVEMLWTSSCDGSKGTLGASKEQLSGLFLSQVPGSAEYIPFETSPILQF